MILLINILMGTLYTLLGIMLSMFFDSPALFSFYGFVWGMAMLLVNVYLYAKGETK